MIRRLRDLVGWTFEGADGDDVGTTEDFYFDDEEWKVRYLVANTGSWLIGRSVLIVPASIGSVDWQGGRIRTNLTREQVRNSPPADTTRPITREYEAAYLSYYGYPHYWMGAGPWGAGEAALARPVAEPGAEPVPVENRDNAQLSHLRSVNEVSGYHIQAVDGEIGHVDDFMADDNEWVVRYLVIDTSNWIGGRNVLVSPDWVRNIDWAQRKIHVDMTREKVKDSPEYDPAMRQLDRDYEDRLHRHYERKGYWKE